MKKILVLILLISNLFADQSVMVIKVVKYPWNLSCSNGVDYYTIFQTMDTKRVYKASCSILGNPGMIVKLPDNYKAEQM